MQERVSDLSTARAVLLEASCDQRKDPNFRTEITPFMSPNQAFGKIWAGGDFCQLYGECTAALDQQRDGSEGSNQKRVFSPAALRNLIAGSTHEMIAARVFSWHSNRIGATALSPERTVVVLGELYEQIFDSVDVNGLAFGLCALRGKRKGEEVGLPNPDSIAIDSDGNVTLVGEFTLQQERDYFHKKRVQFRRLRAYLGDLMRDSAQCMILVPRDIYGKMRGWGKKDGVDLEPLPFEKNDFRENLTRLFPDIYPYNHREGYRKHGRANLSSIQPAFI